MVRMTASQDRGPRAQADGELDRRLVRAIVQMHEFDRGLAAGAVVESREIDIGEIAEMRHAAHISQEEFAARLGISVATLRNWEQGRRKPTGPARKLLDLLQQHPEIVLDLDPGE